jgi:hypothetical protein
MASQEPPPGEVIISIRVPCREGKERVWQAMNLAPSGRTLLISDVPEASPTASSHLQGCQHELGHGLCPIPVNSSS